MDGDPSTVNLDPYADPVGIWTIGWGHAICDGPHRELLRGRDAEERARDLYPGGITLDQAEALLREDMAGAARDVLAVVRVPLTDCQFGALVSFVFNVGLSHFRRSTLLRKLNDGDHVGAADEFRKWVFAKGVLLEGLIRRRKAERDLFVRGAA